MNTPKINYQLIGDDMQVVEIKLVPGETIIAEAGAMNWMEDDIAFETKLGDGSAPEKGFFERLFDAGKRVLVGESAFITHLTNQGKTNRKVGFGAPYPGKVIPIDLEAFSGRIFCQRDTFLCATLGTRISIALNQRLGGFFANEGFIVQQLDGDGQVFLHTGGTVIKKVLGDETLKVSVGCLVAYSQGIQCDVERIRGFENLLFGGQGAYVTKLTGTGVVYLQSLPFSKLANQVISRMPVKHKTRERKSSFDH